MRYQFISAHRRQYTVSMMSRVLEVSRSGYYAWLRRSPSARQQAEARLKVTVRTVFEEHRGVYGSPRLYRELEARGIRCGENRIARIMQEEGLCALVKRHFRVTTQSTHSFPVAENVLNRQFSVEYPDQVWCSDITYIWTREGWLYLAVVIDLYSRRIVGWALRPTLDRELVCAALQMALETRGVAPGWLHHSDRGSQYASLDFQALLHEAQAQCSMSRRGNCWDNAVVESFFATLKRELVYRRRFHSRDEARAAIFEWIEVFYNRKRRHSALGYLSPVVFENQYQGSPIPA